MPRVRTMRTKKPPEGFDEIEDTLLEFNNRMKDIENTPHEGKKKNESLWPVFRLNHQRSRYIYDLYYTRSAISSELYQWLLKQGYADGNLIAKWKKQGYEKLCCLRCIQAKENNFHATCVCRVPRAKIVAGTSAEVAGDDEDDDDEDRKTRKKERVIECVTCGCRGCASSD
ncbi:G10 protein-domain-containing protein [Dipodascopsis tothii]|uniref:G10 protein-domain-containing protein n=1 Tax=Dipodascopsis tothii TaxID=44089 RepID=UPI0034CF46D6